MQAHLSCSNVEIDVGYGNPGTGIRVLAIDAKMDDRQGRDAIMELLSKLSDSQLREAVKEIAEEYAGYIPAQPVAPETISALENISGNAPAKEPRNYASVGFMDHHRNVEAEAADEAVSQAFEEGKARAWWEASQMVDAVIKSMGA